MWTKHTCQRRLSIQNDPFTFSKNKTSTSGLCRTLLSNIKNRKSKESSRIPRSSFSPSNTCLKSSSSCTAHKTSSSLSSSIVTSTISGWISNNIDLFLNVILALVILLCYFNSLNGHFLHDDIPAIVDNPDVIGTRSFLQLFRDDFWGMHMSNNASHKSYRPITTITFR